MSDPARIASAGPRAQDFREPSAERGENGGGPAVAIASATKVHMQPKGRILIVDDEANARSALAELMREEGYSVETAADGFKALPKLEEFGPDLLLTDLRMPGMDGLELMRKAREELGGGAAAAERE